MGDDGPIVHAHVVLGLSGGTTRGGHLLEGWVYPTLEAVVTESPATMRKVLQPELGIARIDLDQSDACASPRGSGNPHVVGGNGVPCTRGNRLAPARFATVRRGIGRANGRHIAGHIGRHIAGHIGRHDDQSEHAVRGSLPRLHVRHL